MLCFLISTADVEKLSPKGTQKESVYSCVEVKDKRKSGCEPDSHNSYNEIVRVREQAAQVNESPCYYG